MNRIELNPIDLDPAAAAKILERGDILCLPQTPFDISAEDRAALLQAGQADGNFHKNISYRPLEDRIAGLGKTVPGESAAIHRALRNYSRNAIALLERLLAPYRSQWRLDYASFRSIEEEGRDLPWKKRNDLLHTDAFPTRPTNGGLILRIFTNINPSKERVWVTSDPFAILAPQYAEAAGLAAGARPSLMKRVLSRRSPYDEFMLGFHDFLKSNETYQRETPKYRFSFPPDSTWMAFTDVVPHSVLSGRFALEQTIIVSQKSLSDPRRAPIAILENLAGRALAR